MEKPEGLVITIEDLRSEKNDGWFVKIESVVNRNPTLKAAYFFKLGSEERLLNLLRLTFEQERAKHDLQCQGNGLEKE